MNESNIIITGNLAIAILTFLRNGGSHIEGGLLADALVEQANKPNAEKENREKFENAVAEAIAAKTKKKIEV